MIRWYVDRLDFGVVFSLFFLFLLSAKHMNARLHSVHCTHTRQNHTVGKKHDEEKMDLYLFPLAKIFFTFFSVHPKLPEATNVTTNLHTKIILCVVMILTNNCNHFTLDIFYANQQINSRRMDWNSYTLLNDFSIDQAVINKTWNRGANTYSHLHIYRLAAAVTATSPITQWNLPFCMQKRKKHSYRI